MAKDSSTGSGDGRRQRGLWRRTAPSRRAVHRHGRCSPAAVPPPPRPNGPAGRSSPPPAPSYRHVHDNGHGPRQLHRRSPGIPLWTPGPPAVEVVHRQPRPSNRSPSRSTATGIPPSPRLCCFRSPTGAAPRSRSSPWAAGCACSTRTSGCASCWSSGHELANHTFTHPELATYGRGRGRGASSPAARDVLLRVSGARTGRWARPSAMDRATPLVRAAAGPSSATRTVDRVRRRPGRLHATRVRRPSSRARWPPCSPGSIVSLHLGHTSAPCRPWAGILDGLVRTRA